MKLGSFLTLAIDWGKSSASLPGRFMPKEQFLATRRDKLKDSKRAVNLVANICE
jgi:hypothetical protein